MLTQSPAGKSTIMVTGAAGFIGSHLCELLLNRGHAVLGVDGFDDFYNRHIKERNVLETAKTARKAGKWFRLHEVDIRDPEKMGDLFRKHNVEAVIHLAARVGVRPSVENAALYRSVNVDGTANLLARMEECGVRRLVFASSSSVYGNSPRIPFSEKDAAIRPISPYGVTKKVGEELCYIYYRLHDISAACLRFFTVFGPRQRPDLAIHTFVRRMSEGRAIPVFGNGSTERDYTYVDDIVDGIYKALTWTENGINRYDIFNLGRGQPVSLAELITTVADTLGVKPTIEYLPPQPGDVLMTCADISRAGQVLSYSPRMPLQEGIRAFVDWYRETRGTTPGTTHGEGRPAGERRE